MKPEKWYELLNGKLFFWVARERLKRFLNARSYRDRAHLVLGEDGGVARMPRWASLAVAINSGTTFPGNPAPRGPETFRRIAEHPAEKPIMEPAVNYVSKMSRRSSLA